MKKNFLHYNIKSLEISRFRFIVGLIIGLSYSFVFYSLQYVIREILRLLSTTEYYEIWVLTDAEVNFYNLFHAYISVIIGQSICFTYWIEKPKRVFKKRSFKIVSIINDQRSLIWFFLSWFSKLAILYGLIFGYTFYAGYHYFSLYPDYKYLLVLIIIVLFFQTWKTVRVLFKQQSIKWVIFSVIAVSFISFGISRVKLIDYQSINNLLLQKSVFFNYKIDLPVTEIYQKHENISSFQKIFIVQSKDLNDNSEPKIIIDNQEVSLNELLQKITEWQLKKWPRMICKLHIHKGVKMEFINKLKYRLSNAGISKIAYAVIPNNSQYDPKYYYNHSFIGFIPKYNSDLFDSLHIFKYLNSFENTIELSHHESGKYTINGTLINPINLKEVLKKSILKNSSYLIKFHIDDKDDFSSYLTIITSTVKVINDLRNDYSLRIYSTEFSHLDYNQKKEVRKKFPIRIFELTKHKTKLWNINRQ